MDIMRLLEDLTEQMQDVKTFGPIAWGFSPDDMAAQITKIRSALPQEIKLAHSTAKEADRIIEEARADQKRIVSESEAQALEMRKSAEQQAAQILDQARKEADVITNQARLDQQRMISESEVLKKAEEAATSLRSKSEREAADVRRGADTYAYDLLVQLEGVLGRASATIEKGKQELRPGEKATTPAPAAAPVEKARVKVN